MFDESVDSLRRQAKQLVKSARDGDPVIIESLRAQLPQLASLDNAAVAREIKLADVQHAMARTSGRASWKELIALAQQVDSIDVHAARFLQAVSNEQVDRAIELLSAHPAIAEYSIHTAATVGNVSAVRTFIAANPASATLVTKPDDNAPIIYAVLSKIKTRLNVDVPTRVELVRVLLDAGASPNTSVPFGEDARIPLLYFPSAAGDAAVVKLLLERGANGRDGESVYHAAEHNRRECLALLLEYGADISGTHASFGNTPLYFLAGYRDDNHQIASVTAGMQWLLEHGADPNVFSTPKPSPHETSAVSELPLHRIAATRRSADVARMFVEHGAAVDIPRGDGKTAYAMAVRAGNTAVAEYLASVGADTSRVAPVDLLLSACDAGDEMRARARLSEHPSLIASLTNEDAQALNVAVGANRGDAVRLMLSLGWPLHIESEWGGTPLHWAAWRGRVELVRLLIAQGAPINQRDRAYGSSPLAWAAHGSVNAERDADDDYVAIVHMLLDAGATRAESYNSWNESPESMGRPAVVRALKERGFAV